MLFFYPLIYFRQLTKEAKKIRTVFIDIVAHKEREEHRLVKVVFEEDCFDALTIGRNFVYES